MSRLTVGADQIPVDLHMSHTLQTVVTLATGGFAVGAIVIAPVAWARTRAVVYPMVLLSGLLCTPNEPIADIPAKIYHFGPGSWHLYTGFGRPIPVWVLTAYIMFFGGLTAIFVLLL